jgi:zinc protease
VRTDASGEALKELIGEFDGPLTKRPFTDEEIAVARTSLIRAFPESMEDPQNIAAELADMARYGLPTDYLSTYLERLQATNDEQVRKAMAELLNPDQRMVLIVGDRSAVEPQLKQAGFASPQSVDVNGRRMDANKKSPKS